MRMDRAGLDAARLMAMDALLSSQPLFIDYCECAGCIRVGRREMWIDRTRKISFFLPNRSLNPIRVQGESGVAIDPIGLMQAIDEHIADYEAERKHRVDESL